MAVNLLSHHISELCLGKPALKSLSITTTVTEALSALKRSGETCLSVWDCLCSVGGSCRCVGKVSVTDVICFLASDENLKSPATALQAPIAGLIPKPYGLVSHLEPNASLLEAIEAIRRDGAQNIVIPIQIRSNNNYNKADILGKSLFSSPRHNNRDHCWITQEDITRYLLSFIGLFSPTPLAPICSLGLIKPAASVHHDSLAASALPLTGPVAVVDSLGRLVAEISPQTLDSCNEAVAAAVATLSAGDLVTYVESYGGPPAELVRAVKERLEVRGLEPVVDMLMEGEEDDFFTSSSDEEFGRSVVSSGRVVRPCEAVVCLPQSSLVAVMVQALAHRSGYVWVVEEDGTLSGIVDFAGMLNVLTTTRYERT